MLTSPTHNGKRKRFKSSRHERTLNRERQKRWRERQQLAKAKAKAAASATLPGMRSAGDVAVLAGWCGSRLRVPSGRLQANQFDLQPWQVQFLDGALADGVMESALSVARKNGKSGLIAALLLGYMVGPLQRRGWRGIVCSLTGRLSAELMAAMESIAGASGLTGLAFKRSPPPGQVLVRDHDIVLDFLAADKASGHAMGADIAVIDEAGLLEENKRELWNAMLSSVSGRDGKLIAISIRGHGPMFTELIERADSEFVHVTEYAAPPECELDDEAAWLAANPGLNSIKSREYMIRAAQRAVESPANQSSFRAYDLNQPQEPERVMILSLSAWQACLANRDRLPNRSGPVCLGIDMGGSTSMTCAVAYWPDTNRAEIWGAFPEVPDLLARGETDGVGGLYRRMFDRGELATYPGRVTDVARFLDDCATRLHGSTVFLGCDRFRKAEMEEALSAANITWPVAWRGQGHSHTADGSRDVRAFQRLALRGRWVCEESLMMGQAIAQSSLAFDESGNPKLKRAKSTGRIDALQAGVIAAGMGERMQARPPVASRYRGLA